jgi:N-acetyl-alpha-D-glucosaminyl L-malate synthase BshA
MVKLHDIDLLHVHYAIPHAYAAFMAQQMLKDEGILIPIVTTLHGTDITLVGSHPFYKPAVTFSINKSDAVTSVSESLKKDTLRLFNIKKEINVVPNFIDLEKHLNNFTDCQRGMMADDNERIITHISNMREVKQIPDVIKIFYNIQKALPAKLMMVGEGPEKEGAELLVEELGISDRVIFFGNSNEIDRILCFSDLFLLPSQTESFGLAALEAMASSVPVISTNTGGLPEVNEDGYSGYLSEVNAIEDMSENAIKILSDIDILNQFKANAKVQSQKFDLHNIVPMYERIYEETLKKFLVLN